MALVLTDLGADQILKALLNNNWPASKNLKLRLFSNNYTPVDTSVRTDFTEVTGGGYAAISLANGSWTVSPANGSPRPARPKASMTWRPRVRSMKQATGRCGST